MVPSGSATYAGPIDAATVASEFSVGGAGSLTLSGPIGSNGFSAGITKLSNSTLTLSGTADNFGMELIVNAGTVILAKASTATVHAVGGGSLFIQGGTVQLAGTGGDQIYDGALVEVSSGSFDANGLSETADEFDFQGTGINNTGALLNSAPGDATLGANFFSLISDATIGVSQSTASLTLVGTVSDNGFSNLTKIGPGGVSPSSETSVSVATSPSPPAALAVNGNLSANVVVNDATFTFNGGAFNARLVNAGTLVLNADLAASLGLDNESSFTIPTGRLVSLGGPGLFHGGTLTLAGGTLTLSTAANANNTNAGNFNISLPLLLGAANLTNSGEISLAGSVISGSGTLANTLGGIITGSGSITAALTNAGTIAPAGGTLTIPALTNNGTVEMTSATALLSGSTPSPTTAPSKASAASTTQSPTRALSNPPAATLSSPAPSPTPPTAPSAPTPARNFSCKMPTSPPTPD